MNEQEIFYEALEIDDVQSRSAFLDQACGGDQRLRQQVDALLEESARSGEFLGVPAMEQIRNASGVTRVASGDVDPQVGDLDLSFLEPPKVEGSLGSLCHYDIQELIGRGGCGIVFKAFDQRLHRIVAIKVMTPAMAVTSPARKRFLREARATAAIRHENVVNIYAVEEAPLPFLVMEYIDGKTLQQVLDENGPLELPTICRLGKMIANGLEAAHQQGLIHRDIKPANILIESGTDQVKLTDFGLARAADDASRSQSGIIAGTPLYMSPEQVQGIRLDQRSDLFSLGSVLYVMCTGRAPFRAPSTLAVLKRVVDEQPRNIQEIISEIPDWLVALIHQLHAKDPEKRFASAQQVADLLAGNLEQNLLNQNPVEEPAPANPNRLRIGRFSWIKVAAVLILLLSSFGFTEATGITNVRGTVIRLFSPEGTLVIEVDDPGVSVSIDGQEMVITGAGVKELRLKPGQYQLQATKDGEVLQQELVTITRNGRQLVRVSREPAPAALKPVETASQPTDSKTVDPDRRAAEYVLSIGGKVRLNDDSRHGEKEFIASIKELPDSPFRLTHVELINNRNVTDTGMAALRGTKNLRFVNLAYSPEFTDAGLAHLSDNRGLQRLDLWGTNITKKGIEYFVGFSDLRDLRLGDTQLSAVDLSILKQYVSLQKLEILMLTLTQADDGTLAILSDAHQLIQLNLEETDITDVGLSYLEENRNLEYLYLKGTKVTAPGVRRLSRILPKLDKDWNEPEKPSTSSASMLSKTDSKSVDPDRRAAEYVLSVGGKVWVNKDSAFTDKNVIQTREKLPSEPFRLTHADLQTNSRVTDAGLAAFRGTKHLRGIYLTNSTNVGDAGILHLRENSNLHEIHLWGTKVSGKGLQAFSNCASIIDFYIGYTRVKDADMPFFRSFAGWKTLRCIMISGLDITDEGIANLAGAPGLGQIHLEQTKITDAGLLQLAKCPKLGLIWAFDTKFTPEGIERFMQARNGKCGILWEEPGMPPESVGAVVSNEPAPPEVDADFSRVWRLTTMQPQEARYGWEPGPRRVFVSPKLDRCHEYLVVDQRSSITWSVPEGTRSFTATGMYNFGSYISFNVAFDGRPASSNGVTRIQNIDLDVPAGCRTITLSVGRVTDKSEFYAGCPVYWLKPRFYDLPLTEAHTAPETENFTKLTTLKPTEGDVKIVHDGSYQTNPDELTIEPPADGVLPYCSDLLWAHANSKISYDIPEGAQRFRAIGTGYRSRSVRFAVQFDGKETYRSPIAGIVSIDVPIPAGAEKIVLLTDDCGDQQNDWADWCYPRFVGK